MATESLTNTHTLIVSLAQEGIGGAGEKLDEIRLVVAVLDRALALAGMVDTLEQFGVHAMPSSSRIVTLFEDKTPSARTVFRGWASSNGLLVEESSPAPSNGYHRVLIACRPHSQNMRRDVAALHLISEPTTKAV